MVNAATDYKMLMYQLPLNRVAFNRDNKTVFSYIQLAVLKTPIEMFILDTIADSAAMRALCMHYKGGAKLDVCATVQEYNYDI